MPLFKPYPHKEKKVREGGSGVVIIRYVAMQEVTSNNATGTTGGTQTIDGSNTVHTFTVSGTFTPSFTGNVKYRDWETDRKSTRLNSSHSAKSRMPSSA